MLQKLRKVGYFVSFWSSAADGHKLQSAVNCRKCLQELLLGQLEAVCANWRLSHSNYIVYCSANQQVFVCLSVTASRPVSLQIKLLSFSCTTSRHEYYKGDDKSLARPGRKQATATEDFYVHISYLLS